MSAPTIRLAVDAVVFGYDPKDGISVLLIQRKYDPFKGGWAIPGGLVLENENLETAVERELEEETGVKVDYLEQLYTFGELNRDPRNRVVAVAYYGLVKKSDFHLYASTDADDAKWFNWTELPELAFDHVKILETAIERLKGKIRYEPIGFELLDDKFPFSDLHKLYEAILEVDIDRRNFKKKFLQLDILNELDEKISEGKGRPGSLFQFNSDRYFAMKKAGINFEV
ncbi:MAG: NUDIX domain-containing protein [Crocinitomicaceae bacterium]|nr:NUDIX domain-containing protein [Crocinitomicaceae bacterium]